MQPSASFFYSRRVSNILNSSDEAAASSSHEMKRDVRVFASFEDASEEFIERRLELGWGL